MSRRASSPFFADLDGDGDFDILVGNKSGEIAWIENLGTQTIFNFGPRMPIMADNKPLEVEGRDARPEYVDWDADGIKDLLVGCGDGSVVFFKGIEQSEVGPPVFEQGRWFIAPHRFGYRAKVCAHDWNEDGHLDLLLGDFNTADKGGNVWLILRQGEGSGHQFQIVDEKGVVTAISSGGPKYKGPLFSYELITELASDPEHEESAISQPSGIVRDTDGNFCISDIRRPLTDSCILVYSPIGQYLRSFGYPTGEPGEFRRPEIVGFEDYMLHIYDRMTLKLMIFQTDGKLIETVYSPVSSRSALGLYKGPENTRIMITLEERREGSSLFETIHATVYDQEGDVSAVIRTPELKTGVVRSPQGGTHKSALFPFPTSTYIAGKGILISSGAEPVLEWHDLTGELISRIRIELPSEEINDETLRTIEEVTPNLAKILLQPSVLPEEHPYWHQVIIDDAGYYWLSTFLQFAGTASETSTPFILLSPDGEYLGVTNVPGTYMPMQPCMRSFSKGHMMTFIYDRNTGTWTPMVYRLIPTAEGFTYP